jgi:Uma2 family endonuclease
MPSDDSKLRLRYEFSAAETNYRYRLLPDFPCDAPQQRRQRGITLASLELLRGRRPDVHVFNDVLIQYLQGDQIKQVVPHNMVVVHEGLLRVDSSYDMPFQPCGPLWVLEYVINASRPKQFEDSFRKYEQELRVPYCLRVYPEDQELTLYHHDGRVYVPAAPDAQGRHSVEELDLQVGLADGWVRYWHRGRLLLLPTELDRQLDEVTRRAQEEARLRAEAEQARQALEQELARLRAQLGPPPS